MDHRVLLFWFLSLTEKSSPKVVFLCVSFVLVGQLNNRFNTVALSCMLCSSQLVMGLFLFF